MEYEFVPGTRYLFISHPFYFSLPQQKNSLGTTDVAEALDTAWILLGAVMVFFMQVNTVAKTKRLEKLSLKHRLQNCNHFFFGRITWNYSGRYLLQYY